MFVKPALVVLLVGVVGALTANLFQSTPQLVRGPAFAQARCASLDKEASEGIATLIADSSAVAEWKLDQALLQLRRARKHCRSGAEQIAYHDYVSLHRTFALPMRSSRPGNPSLPIVSVTTADK
jgi:hypothetical protein